MTDELVVVFETCLDMVARVVCSLLESDGVPFIREPEFPSPVGHLDTAICPVRVRVPKAHAQRAFELIREFENAEIVDQEFHEEPEAQAVAEAGSDPDEILRRMQRS